MQSPTGELKTLECIIRERWRWPEPPTPVLSTENVSRPTFVACEMAATRCLARRKTPRERPTAEPCVRKTELRPKSGWEQEVRLQARGCIRRLLVIRSCVLELSRTFIMRLPVRILKVHFRRHRSARVRSSDLVRRFRHSANSRTGILRPSITRTGLLLRHQLGS